jgi:hypothetical protein
VSIEGALLRVRRYQRVDLLGGQATEVRIRESAGRRLEALLRKQQVHGMVGRDIPAPPRAMIAAREMPERAVQGLVREHELGLRERQHLEPGRIEVDRPRIGRRGLAPRRIGRNEREVQHQRADEGLLQDEARARRAKLGGNAAQGVTQDAGFMS